MDKLKDVWMVVVMGPDLAAAVVRGFLSVGLSRLQCGPVTYLP
jgi:hypothetical protein